MPQASKAILFWVSPRDKHRHCNTLYTTALPDAKKGKKTLEERRQLNREGEQKNKREGNK